MTLNRDLGWVVSRVGQRPEMSPERQGFQAGIIRMRARDHMTERVPEFPYHTDPLTTGFVEMSDATCLAGERVRGFIYTGPVFAVEELDESLCPWCIADGSAAARFEATFTGDVPVPEDVPGEVVKLVTTRTPGLAGGSRNIGCTAAVMAPPSSELPDRQSFRGTPRPSTLCVTRTLATGGRRSRSRST